MSGQEYKNEMNKFPLSDHTIGKRFTDLAEDIEANVKMT